MKIVLGKIESLPLRKHSCTYFSDQPHVVNINFIRSIFLYRVTIFRPRCGPGRTEVHLRHWDENDAPGRAWISRGYPGSVLDIFSTFLTLTLYDNLVQCPDSQKSRF